ncbi:unnamed protein product [Thelazia callipaeda]|uniref:CUB domain-containing protein n=1 Tax=Thelazia callipaeda TaxID=103827 RepID=A0A0N5CUC3_THECL|nr:unnamed protein product [Thelazia callipaeda]
MILPFCEEIKLSGAEANRTNSCECQSVNFGIDISKGELKSPGYPIKYCSNLNCKYEIDAILNESVHLVIDSFETEQQHDYLEIHQTFIFANIQHSTPIITLSGRDIDWPTFASSIGCGFILKFITDSTETFGGFHAQFTRISTVSPKNSCPVFFYEVTGEERSLPSPPIDFMYSAGCTYLLNTTDGYGVKLKLKSLATVTKFTVYEMENYNLRRNNMASPLFQSTRLTDIAVKEIVSRTNSILIQVVVRQQNTMLLAEKSKFLFEAEYSRIDSPCKCFPRSHTIQSDRVTWLTSPGFPLEYCDKLDCETELKLDLYTIDATYHNTIIIEIHTFSLEHGSDFLHFFDKWKHSSKHLISYTGELISSRNRFFTFNGESAELRLITDSTVVRKGFNLSISAIKKEEDCRCKGIVQPFEFSSPTATFTFISPANCGFLDCFFQFNRPTNVLDSDRIRLILNLTYVFKNGAEEFLEVLTNINNYNIIPSYVHERDITVFDGTFLLNDTKVIINDSPLMIWYHLASDSNKQISQLNFNYEWRKICECGNPQLYAEKGTWKKLTSPDYPSHYCNLMECQYLITAPEGCNVLLNITELALEPNEDILTIFDGSNITDRQISLATGVEIFTELLESSAETMTIYFQTDISITSKGFVIYYTAGNLIYFQNFSFRILR